MNGYSSESFKGFMHLFLTAILGGICYYFHVLQLMKLKDR